MTKLKKWIIAGSVIGGILITLIVLTFTLFALKKVEVNYKSSTVNLSCTTEEIMDSAGIDYGGTVFFRNKSKYIKNLEKTYPYIKVVNIETRFPSTFVIHVAEREEVYAVKKGESYYIVDDEFKILKIVDSFESDQTNAILLSDITVKDKNYEKCDKLQVTQDIDLYSAFYENNRKLFEQKSLIKEIKYSLERDENTLLDQDVLTLKLFNGQSCKIVNTGYGLKYKVNLFLTVYGKMYDFVGQEITLKDGSTIILSEENLNGATIVVNNLYQTSGQFDKDCYFDILPNTL